jgi:nanoRNase/pAp phosphatase (c-di-AMP/oligoRNAs hydrolase)
VSEIAKKYSGGGHKKASGFVCKELPFVNGKNKVVDELRKQFVDGAVQFTPEQMNVINKEFWNLG